MSVEKETRRFLVEKLLGISLSMLLVLSSACVVAFATDDELADGATDPQMPIVYDAPLEDEEPAPSDDGGEEDDADVAFPESTESSEEGAEEVVTETPEEIEQDDPVVEDLTVQADNWNVRAEGIRNTTNATLIIDPALVSDSAFDSVTFTARMTYNGSIVREATKTFTVDDFSDDGSVVMDFENYGKFTLTTSFQKGGSVVGSTSPQTVGIVADVYNISPVSATLPVTFFSLNLWGEGSIRNSGPVILMMERPAAYNWDELPDGVYGLPFLSPEELSYQPGDFGAAANNFRNHEQTMADYVHDLVEISPDSYFNLYCVDFYSDLIQRIIYANRIPEGNYSIKLLSDGSFTAAEIAKRYDGSDPASQHQALVDEWNAYKTYAYSNGRVDSAVTPGSCPKYLWAVVDSEPNAELWVARKDILKTPNDGNAFGAQIQANPKVVQVSIGNLLKQNIQADPNNEAEFKALYNFNDSFFAAAEEQGKDAMVFLGSRVTSEETFVNYARFVMSYYGDDYLYYYKGHPGTPTDLYPEKVEQLDSLGVTDVDSSIAAELILFFNPEIYLSGYASSTYASVPVGMGKGMFSMTREKGLSDPQYENMDFWMTKVGSNTDQRARVLCASGHENYLVEFNDAIAADAGFPEVGSTGTRYIAIWDASTSEITYYVLNDDETAYELVGSDSGINVKAPIEEGTYVIQTSLANGKVLDVAGGSKSSGANVQLYAYNGTNAQKWDISFDAEGYATIKNVGSGLALDVAGANKANSTNVRQYTPNGSRAQKWVISREGNLMSIVSALDPSISLDVAGAKTANGTNVQIYKSNGTKAQRFQLTSVNPSISAEGQAEIPDGYYTIVTALDTNLRLTPSERSKDNGTNVVIKKVSNTAYQTYKITKLSNGFYSVVNAYTGTALDVDGGSIMAGTNVHLWRHSATNRNQQWKIVEHTGGSYTFQNVSSGLMLDVAGAKKVHGTNVCGYTANGSQAQRWLLKTVSNPSTSIDEMARENLATLRDGTYEICSSLDRNLVLDVKGAGLGNGVNVQTWKSNGTNAQRWKVTHDENGYVTFTNVGSGKVLDIAGGKGASGTNVWQYGSNGTKAQKWIVVPGPSGDYEIVSAYSPYLVLDVAGGSRKQGANVQVYSGNGTQAQRFVFVGI